MKRKELLKKQAQILKKVDLLAQIAGVSHDTIHKVKVIEDKVSEV